MDCFLPPPPKKRTQRKKRLPISTISSLSDPAGTQTQDLQNRNLTLYSTKLRGLFRSLSLAYFRTACVFFARYRFAYIRSISVFSLCVFPFYKRIFALRAYFRSTCVFSLTHISLIYAPILTPHNAYPQPLPQFLLFPSNIRR